MVFYGLLFVYDFIVINGDILPGLKYIGNGYNILYGNPYSSKNVDPGYLSQIFNMSSFNSNQNVNGYEIPDGITASISTECNTELIYNEINGVNSYSSTLQESIDVGSSFLDFAFSGSKEYQSVYQQTTAYDNIYTASVTHCSAYFAELNAPFSLPNFTDNFIKYVEQLPTVYNNETNGKYFYPFINEYFGTHYIIKTTLGGIYGIYSDIDSYSYASFASSNLDISQCCGFNMLSSTAAESTMTDTEITQGNDFSKIVINNITFNIGGEIPATGLNYWYQTLKSHSMPIFLNLQPITQLLTPNLFPNDPNITQKANALNIAIQNYCYTAANDSNNNNIILKCEGNTPDKPTPQKSIFGGIYIPNHSNNPYTNKQSCLDGYTLYPFMNYKLQDMTLYFCLNETQISLYNKDGMNYFGGYYVIDTNNNCIQSNPLTNNTCICPTNYSIIHTNSWCDKHHYWYNGYYCINNNITLPYTIMAGFYQSGHIPIYNFYTKSLECPQNYNSYIIGNDIICDDATPKKTCNLYVCINNIYSV